MTISRTENPSKGFSLVRKVCEYLYRLPSRVQS